MGQSRKVRRGGALSTDQQTSIGGHGIDVSGIAGFSPAHIQDLALWFSASPDLVVQQPVQEYILEQLPVYKAFLLEHLGSRLTEPVITRIKSRTPLPNALVPIETHDSIKLGFPTLLQTPDQPSGFALGQMGLVTETPIELPPNFSLFSITRDLTIQYNDILDRVILTPQSPDATFHEIIVYARQLTPEEAAKLEGYITYKSDQQYTLRMDHPYFPDMAATPVLKPIMTSLEPIEDSLRILLRKLDKRGGDPVLRGELADTIRDLKVLRYTLSRGVLLTRNSPLSDLSAVYAAINARDLYPVDMTDAQVRLEFDRARALIEKVKTAIEDIDASKNKAQAEQVFAANEQTIAAARKEAETDEGLRTMEYQVRRRERVQAHRATKAELAELGSMLLGDYRAKFQAELRTCQEAFEYQTAQRENRLKGLQAELEEFAAPLRTGAWLAEFPFLDQGKESTGEFRDPILRVLFEKFSRIQAALLEDDVAYLNMLLGLATKEAKGLVTLWNSWPTAALFGASAATGGGLYVGHLRQKFQRAERYQADLNSRLDAIEAAIRTLRAELETLKTTQALKPQPLTLLTGIYRPQEPLYYSGIGTDDAGILRLEFIRCEATGAPLLELGPTGDLDLEFVFPEFLDLERNSEPPNSWRIRTPHKTAGGEPAYQIYIQCDPQSASILKSLPEGRLPAPREIDLSAAHATQGSDPCEIPREFRNSVVRINGGGALQKPINLPKYAVRAESFFVLQNIGRSALVVRNPGAQEDFYDLLGPGETAVYMYGEGRALTGRPGYAYGYVQWRQGMLPYDTIRDTPRSSVACFIKEIGRTLYCLEAEVPGQMLEPLITRDGYFIECHRAADDGSVYDAHDFSRANPYSVRVLPERSLSELKPLVNSKGRLAPANSDPYPVIAEYRTGCAILCTRGGLPALDEFGYAGALATPIHLLSGALKVRGAYEDLVIKGSDVRAFIPYRIPEGITFDGIYRSRFCKPLVAAQETASDPVRTPVFCTGQGLPLCGPRGTCIRVPADARQEQTLLTFKDGNGVKQAFLIDEVTPITDANGEEIPWRPIELYIVALREIEGAHQLVYRYASSLSYLKGLSDLYTKTAEELRASLGDATTDSIRKSIAETKEMVDTRIAKFAEAQPKLLALAEGLKGDLIPDDVKMGLGTFDIQMRDTLQEITDLTDTLEVPLDSYRRVQRRIANLQAFLQRLGAEGGTLFSKGYEFISAIRKFEIERTQSVSTPQVDALLDALKGREADYRVAQQGLEARFTKRPDAMNEIREWLLDLQTDAAKQYAALESAKGLVLIELPRRLTDADKQNTGQNQADLKSTYKEEQALTQIAEGYLQFFDPARPGSPEIQDPMVARTKKGPFVHLVNPNYQRDIKGTLSRRLPADLRIEYELMIADMDATTTIVDSLRAEMKTWGQAQSAEEPPKDKVVLAQTLAREKERLATFQKSLGTFEAYIEPIFQGYLTFTKMLAQKWVDTTKAEVEGLRKLANDLDAQRVAMETTSKMVTPARAETAIAILKRIPVAIPQDIVLEIEKHTAPVLTGAIQNPFVFVLVLNRMDELKGKLEALNREMVGLATEMRALAP